MVASLPAGYLANRRNKLTEMETCKPQKKNINPLNEGQNRIFTLILDPTEKSRLILSCLLLKLYSPRKFLLVFSLINNSGLEAGLESVHT